MKVAIIGAGICGLYLAWKLSEKGIEVVVFEKKEKIGKEVCSGLFSERILDFVPESKNLIQNEIKYCLIHFPKKTLKIEFSNIFFVINHTELDKIVFELAQKSGAKFFFNHFVSLSEIDNFKKKFKKIIGCDGANSNVRNFLKLPNPTFYLGIQGVIPQKDNSNYVETWPTKFGFVWKIPRGKEIEYGIIEKPFLAKKFFNEFLKNKKIFLEKTNSAIIPQGFIIPSNPLITLCGDAAGLTKPWSGGGVIWGLIAADILLKNFPDFLKYKNETKKFFLSKISILTILKKIIYFCGFKAPLFLPRYKKIESDFIFKNF